MTCSSKYELSFNLQTLNEYTKNVSNFCNFWFILAYFDPGLCGNFNADRDDDLILSDGITESSDPNHFGNSFQVNPQTE